MKSKKRWNPRNPIILLSIVLLTFAGINVFANLNPTEAAGNRNYVLVVVQAGDNLWNIAAKSVPSEDPRRVVQEIIEVNNLGGERIRPGQMLEVPSR